jgi:GNAT superfamily N-acetyltransferase
MTATIVRVTTTDMIAIGAQLTQQHYDEVPFGVKGLPMELDWDTYKAIEREGCLLGLAAFDDESNLVGYLVVVSTPLLHHKGKYMAQTDCFYIHPAYRKRGMFEQLLAEAQSICSAAGVVSFRVIVNTNFPLPQEMLNGLGYREAERHYEMEF